VFVSVCGYWRCRSGERNPRARVSIEGRCRRGASEVALAQRILDRDFDPRQGCSRSASFGADKLAERWGLHREPEGAHHIAGSAACRAPELRRGRSWACSCSGKGPAAAEPRKTHVGQVRGTSRPEPRTDPLRLAVALSTADWRSSGLGAMVASSPRAVGTGLTEDETRTIGPGAGGKVLCARGVQKLHTNARSKAFGRSGLAVRLARDWAGSAVGSWVLASIRYIADGRGSPAFRRRSSCCAGARAPPTPTAEEEGASRLGP